jgi:TusA-related sulfurtransferase
MAAKRSLITYTVEVLPRGAALRIATQDPEAVQAIHRFLEFQRLEHRTGQRP